MKNTHIIAISEATYNMNRNAVQERKLAQFNAWSNKAIHVFEQYVNEKRAVYAWANIGYDVYTLAISNNYEKEYSKIKD